MSGKAPKRKRGGDEVPKGLRCRGCNCAESTVLNTYRHPDRVQRRRRCRHCGRVFVTTERLS